MYWSKEEIDLLILNYPIIKTKELLNIFHRRSLCSIKKKANNIGLTKLSKNKTGNCKILLNDNNESYYWIGFILADGSISENCRLRITLSIKDKDHLQSFGKYINHNCSVYNKTCSLSIMDTDYLKKLKDKFDIKYNKTYNPPDLTVFDDLNEDQLLSLIIGYTDGDGSILKQSGRTDCFITYHVHSSWLSFLDLLQTKISILTNTTFPSPTLKNDGYASMNIANIKTLRYLKRKAIELNIPYLRRKWDKIDESRISRYETCDDKRSKIIELYKKGLTQVEISRIVGYNKSAICKILHKLKLND